MTRRYITSERFGPQAEQLRLFLDQVDEAPSDRWSEALPAAWAAALGAARPAARAAARDADRIAALGAARDVTRDAAWAAAWTADWRVAEAAAWTVAWAVAWAAAALVVRDLISAEHYDELTRVVRAAGFVVHPDDEPLSDES